MDTSYIFISSDTDENDELPSLNSSFISYENLSSDEIEISTKAGNPIVTSPSRSSGNSCISVVVPDTRSTSSIKTENPMDITKLSSDEDEDNDFDMQRAIANSLQSLTPTMGNQGGCGGHGKSKHFGVNNCQDSPKTWSRRRAEHAACKIPSLSQVTSALPIYVSSEDSGAEYSDTLPDLDDTLPDLDFPSLASDPLRPLESTLKKFFVMGSPRRIPNRERHFLDTFQPVPKYRKMKDNKGSPKGKEIVESGKKTTKPQSNADQSRKRKDRISQEMQAGSTPVSQEEYKVFTFPPDTSSKTSAQRRTSGPESESRYFKNKFSGVKFLQDLTALPSTVDRMCSDFVKLQTSCLDDLLDDFCDAAQFSNCMDLLEDFCYKRKPHPMLIDRILNIGFFSEVGEEISVRSYHLLLKVWQQFPELVKVDEQSVLVSGDVMQKHLQNSVLSSTNSRPTTPGSRWRGDEVSQKPSVQKSRLYFQLFVKGLQLNLSHCTLADQKSVNKSLAFVCLSSEGSKTLVKKLTHWLEFCLVVRHQEHVTMAKMWMCELQTLLGVCVLVSHDRQEAAKKLSPELKRTYKYLTDLNAKKQLLQSFSCPLLCFYVLRLVMEDQCESTIVSSQFPSTIQEIIHNYYVALPPQDHLTPPPSPSEDEHEVVRRQSRMYSVQSCEELAMLIFFISKSFITCKQKRLNCDLRKQILRGPNRNAMTEEQKRQFQLSVQELSAHLQALCPELSAATYTYLSLLECLCLSM